MSTGSHQHAIGVDVGGTKIFGLVLDRDDPATVLAETRVGTPRGTDELLAAIGDVIETLAQPEGVSVGLGLAGLIDDTGRLRVGPNLPDVVGVAFQDTLGGLLDRPVKVVNDATAAAWGEFQVGAGRGSSDMAMVTLGTGIGGGLVVDGSLYAGANGFAGEVGHMVVDPDGPRCPCGRRGCWERYASGFGLGWLARDAAGSGHLDRVVADAGGDPDLVRGEHVTDAAMAGDEGALAVFDRFSWWLALGLANLAAIIDPDRIVLGGGVITSRDLFIESTRRHFADLLMSGAHRPPISIEPATLGVRAGAIGAALLAP